MRKDATQVEETRLQKVKTIEDYPSFHERHRIFPAIFEERTHNKILDVAAGVGCAAKRISDLYPAELICNDITPKCLQVLRNQGLCTVSFDIDDDEVVFPFPDGYFDAVLSLATIEHVLCLDHHMNEIYRILSNDGFLYISTPNYAGLTYMPRLLLKGQSFHNPLKESAKYEFYAHVRYFTYNTLIDFVSSFGFSPEAVYLPLPKSSSFYLEMQAKSNVKAFLFRNLIRVLYSSTSPRWASEPVVCFKKSTISNKKIRKVIL